MNSEIKYRNTENFGSIKIIDQSSKSIPIDLVKIIKKLLKHIPSDHLIGLDSIVIRDEFGEKKQIKASGLYFKKDNLEPARIELSISRIYGHDVYIDYFIPFIRKYRLAKTLFHEVGHHHKLRCHGISKKREERFANNYSAELIRKTFRFWLYVLKPFRPVIFWLDRVLNKKD